MWTGCPHHTASSAPRCPCDTRAVGDGGVSAAVSGWIRSVMTRGQAGDPLRSWAVGGGGSAGSWPVFPLGPQGEAGTSGGRRLEPLSPPAVSLRLLLTETLRLIDRHRKTHRSTHNIFLITSGAPAPAPPHATVMVTAFLRLFP